MAIWDRARRVCVPKRFPAYFGFGVGDDVLSREQLEEFISKIDNVEHVRAKVKEYTNVTRRAGGTKAAVLLEELSSNIGLIPPTAISKSILGMFNAADLFTNPQDERGSGFLSIPAIWRFWFVMSPLIQKLDEASRTDALKASFAVARPLRGFCFDEVSGPTSALRSKI
jgi:hypothetical protein